MRTIFPIRLFLLFFFTFALLGNAIAIEIPERPGDVKRISMTEFQALLASNEIVIIIDTRTPGQWQQAADKIPGAIRIDSQSALQKFKAEVPPATEIVTYCT
ncbi:Rhodanese-like domain-containing protein [Desulfuromusa kysingii]|uniref:Rhodanese-like domain-containing protein n=1 Tax=Desulfuromusa kysingii TaxID=37625 RepID=A0A1H4CAB7_9BACT|nr:rhodanese-like domain-containing protein [Desulfuromusa kysingii]SEA57317.1 Rhodanese-like domain-containing protein [Desulfuromusa kysingii]